MSLVFTTNSDADWTVVSQDRQSIQEGTALAGDKLRWAFAHPPASQNENDKAGKIIEKALNDAKDENVWIWAEVGDADPARVTDVAQTGNSQNVDLTLDGSGSAKLTLVCGIDSHASGNKRMGVVIPANSASFTSVYLGRIGEDIVDLDGAADEAQQNYLLSALTFQRCL